MKEEIKYIEYLIKEKEKERVDACEEIDHHYYCEEITLLENILKELKTRKND